MTTPNERDAEQWRPVPGYEGSYEVSDKGRVRSLDRRVQLSTTGHLRFVRGRVLQQTRHPTGRMLVGLCRDNQHKTVKVHLLVLLAFVGPRPDGMYGCHNDGDLANNTLGNLRWDTPSANNYNYDAVRHGTQSSTRKTHCPQNHPYDELNTYRSSAGRRECRACRFARGVERRAAQKAQAAA